MGFRLRGGRPKNMGQGIYWVQRHLADAHAAERRRDAEQRRVERQDEKARAFNEKYHRVTRNVSDYFSKYASVDVVTSANIRDKIVEKIDHYNKLNSSMQISIEDSTMMDVSKLATAGRSAMIACAKARGQKAVYDAASKIVFIEGISYDFS